MLPASGFRTNSQTQRQFQWIMLQIKIKHSELKRLNPGKHGSPPRAGYIWIKSLGKLHGRNFPGDRPTFKDVQYWRHLVPKQTPKTIIKFNWRIVMLQIHQHPLTTDISHQLTYLNPPTSGIPSLQRYQLLISKQNHKTKMKFNGRIVMFHVH